MRDYGAGRLEEGWRHLIRLHEERWAQEPKPTAFAGRTRELVAFRPGVRGTLLRSYVHARREGRGAAVKLRAAALRVAAALFGVLQAHIPQE